MNFDALTIVRGRQTHLENQWRGWLQSEKKPDRWIIVGMDQDVIPPGQDDSIEVITNRVDGDGKTLPLAHARNLAANLSQSEYMVFLDVDCIAAPGMLREFEVALETSDRLWMGSPRYLPAGATLQDWSMEELAQSAIPHPIQPRLSTGELRESDEYEKFWSLCFAVSNQTFAKIGGFEESFAGYGAEDTDFAFAARDAGVPFGFACAIAYHQHHAVCKPPLNHFDAIVRNAIQFRRRWNVWPMESWLNAFVDRGLIRFDPEMDSIDILASPTKEDVEQATVLTPAGF
ncbi:glycosyltransferase family 2 protein [Aporhodopirellula aestuarii]|uniref:Galactosyltransferase-related protein n=1 Tax=Aporhodopirellula aestuarii TaxID=2950107 RepID=A0ABT0U9W6_9BACT|nr:galactosyltransferase-related protein [Aporhodopirellula aestuarii]MCM2373666.1 galactosyltransferase-related protein [Aporhodopirellula aestuarii]